MKRTILLSLALIIAGCTATTHFGFAPASPLSTPAPIEMPMHIDAYLLQEGRAVNVTCDDRQVAIIEQYPNRILVGCAGATPTLTATSTFVPEPTETPYPTEFATPTPDVSDAPVATLTLVPTVILPTVTATPCLIKGNINSNGTKLYFLPDHPAYNTITLTPSAGEMWFCDAASAEAAGWTRAP